MDTADDDNKWRCASCGHIHESYNPPCLRCAGERLVRVGADGDATGGESAASDEFGGDTASGHGQDREESTQSEWDDSRFESVATSDTSDTGWGTGDTQQTVTEQQPADPSVQYLCKECGELHQHEHPVCQNCGEPDLAAIREVTETAGDWEDPAPSSGGLFGVLSGLLDTLSTVVAWAFGLLALFTGVSVFMFGVGELSLGLAISGLFATSAGTISLPPTRRRLLTRRGINLPRWAVVVLVTTLWVASNLTLYVTDNVPAGAM
ncbi:hypothetical protein [Haloarchaeobius sp. DFWS5]|uniref:hypothetical protein n=1 Tax=Haloarchaeobius sp. DFWS5 TaxID=3446114 RepID=UPI003EB927BC